MPTTQELNDTARIEMAAAAIPANPTPLVERVADPPLSVPNPVALEEWKLLQAIIGRQEQLIASIRGVCYALLTAFAGGLIAGKVPVSAWLFFAVGCGVTASFLWMELAQRVGLKRAVERSRAVERALRGDATYRGPSLADELTRPVRAQEMYSKLFQNEMIYVPALAVIVVIAVLAIVIHFRTL